MTLGTRTLIGRSDELRAAAEMLERAQHGRGAVLLVSGEPGIGKSRLCEEIARIAGEREIRVCEGRAWEVGGAPAFWPFVQVLRDLLQGEAARGLREQLSRNLGPRLAELAARLPEIALELPEGLVADVIELPAEQARFRLLDSVTRLLCEASEQAPLVVLLEDLHAADASSLLLLDFLSRQIHRARILVVGSYREADAERSLAGAVLAKLPAERVALRRLSPHEAHAFLEHARGAGLDAELSRAFYEASEGNPLFLTELSRLHRADAEPASGAQLPIPSSVKAVIRERMRALPALLGPLLAACAVLGREQHTSGLSWLLESLSSLGREVDLSNDPLVQALEGVKHKLPEVLDACVRADMLQELSPGRFRFTHVLIQQVAYGDLGNEARAALHRAAAEALEREGSDPSFAGRTHHLMAAGASARLTAIHAAKRAAAAAHAQHAHAEAVGFLSQALAALENGAHGDKDRCELLLELGQAELLVHDFEAGRAHCRAARSIARELGDPELFARAALSQGAVFVIGQVTPELVSSLREALELLPKTDGKLRARVMARLAAALQPAADPRPPVELAQEAIAMARRLADTETLLDVVRAGCSAMMDLHDPNEVHALCREHVALAAQLGDAAEAFRGELRSSVAAFAVGDHAAARAAIESCVSLAATIGEPYYQARAHAVTAMRLAFLGRLDEAERESLLAAELGARAGDPNAVGVATLQRCQRLELCGDGDSLLRELPAIERLSASAPSVRDATLIAFAAMLYRAGKPLEAKQLLVRRGITPATLVRARTDHSLLDDIAISAILLEDQAAIEGTYAFLQVHESRWVTGGVFGLTWSGPLTRSLGRLAFALRKLDELEEHAGRAIDALRTEDARALLAHALIEHATQLRELGEHARAEPLLEEARSLAAALGLRIAETAPIPRATTSPLPELGALELVREGDYWSLRSGERAVRLKHQKGVVLLARLIEEPGRELHVLDLLGASGTDGGDSGPLLDQQAKAAYQRRAEDLREQLEESLARNDQGRAERARAELDQLGEELSRAVGLGGRDRRAGAAVERARVNVQRRLRDVITKVSEHDELLGRHLSWAVRTGVYCSYLR